MTKRIVMAVAMVLLCLFFVIAACVRPVSASEIMPLANNVISASSAATISTSGKLTITNQYYGFNGVTTKAVITTYVEKKVLGLFWTRVDINQTNNEWIDTVYEYEYSGSHSVQLGSTGTYRIVVSYVIYGSGGDADEIEKTIEKTY